MNAGVVFLLSFVLFIAVMAFYDMILIMRGKVTISVRIVQMARHEPILAFIMGLVIGIMGGHFFWSMLS